MKTLVTGGGGFLGLYIVEQLVLRGDDVRVFCRGHYDAFDQLDIEVFNGDIRDPSAVSSACESIDAVFHVAAVPGIWGPWELYHNINTLGTKNVIDSCQKQNVRRLIYTSSPSVIFDGNDHIDASEHLDYPSEWLCHYPHSKALGEQAALKSNCEDLKTVSLRPHLIWGPRDNHLIPRLLQKAQSGRLRRVGDGNNVVSVSYVENVAHAHLLAEQTLRESAACAGKAYFINEPEAVNLWEWVNQVLELAGIPPIKKSISCRSAWRIGAAMEFVWKTLRLSGEPPMTRFVASQLAGSHSYSIDAARRDLNYEPLYTMQQGLERLAADLERMKQQMC